MDIDVVDLNADQTKEIEARLDEYERNHITCNFSGSASVGVLRDGVLIAGAEGRMTIFNIFYISNVFVNEDQRGKGIGRKLIECIEKRAASLGANMIRLTTFHRQAAEFYKKLGYELAGQAENKTDGYCEYFFLKHI